jgi:hypothetical protein
MCIRPDNVKMQHVLQCKNKKGSYIYILFMQHGRAFSPPSARTGVRTDVSNKYTHTHSHDVHAISIYANTPLACTHVSSYSILQLVPPRQQSSLSHELGTLERLGKYVSVHAFSWQVLDSGFPRCDPLLHPEVTDVCGESSRLLSVPSSPAPCTTGYPDTPAVDLGRSPDSGGIS